MKKLYTLLILTIAFTTKVFSQQACPSGIYGVGGYNLYYIPFNAGPTGIDFDIFPSEISILATDGVTYITYYEGNHYDNGVQTVIAYNSPNPAPNNPSDPRIDIDNFTVDFGLNFTGSCTYTNLTLPVEEYNFLTENVSIYPTVVSKAQILNLKFSNEVNKYTVVIYDVSGRTLKTVLNQSKKHSELQLSDLNTGIYFLKIQSNGADISKKIIITN